MLSNIPKNNFATDQHARASTFLRVLISTSMSLVHRLCLEQLGVHSPLTVYKWAMIVT